LRVGGEEESEKVSPSLFSSLSSVFSSLLFFSSSVQIVWVEAFSFLGVLHLSLSFFQFDLKRKAMDQKNCAIVMKLFIHSFFKQEKTNLGKSFFPQSVCWSENHSQTKTPNQSEILQRNADVSNKFLYLDNPMDIKKKPKAPWPRLPRGSIVSHHFILKRALYVYLTIYVYVWFPVPLFCEMEN